MFHCQHDHLQNRSIVKISVIWKECILPLCYRRPAGAFPDRAVLLRFLVSREQPCRRKSRNWRSNTLQIMPKSGQNAQIWAHIYFLPFLFLTPGFVKILLTTGIIIKSFTWFLLARIWLSYLTRAIHKFLIQRRKDI